MISSSAPRRCREHGRAVRTHGRSGHMGFLWLQCVALAVIAAACVRTPSEKMVLPLQRNTPERHELATTRSAELTR